MQNRTRIPSVTFLALTDAVTGMIGVLLVVLVLAHPPEEEVYRRQQADVRIACEPVATFPGDKAERIVIRLLESGERLLLDAFLRQRHADRQMSVRLAVRLAAARGMGNQQELACLERLRAQVSRINGTYGQNRSVIHYPYVFLSTYRPTAVGGESP
uniref:Uncharacterized protein n=1 Tax=Candidatus Kentrum sp. FM TaxID=2126340 RepID=A0A450RZ93_9GAMM|nr:MAG: hypothetical protein BECKFM1743C_GA0114222_100146 [Candidatus Kentron sp. FM]VFJ53496.1 MAG: hypothetical protein BECKFM1743A_GA0114220_101156 [Candidatus Kentron sp. FM]VFK06337.1 MAG: hypothetical protein BECKFM1743B_GA0114221_1001412 [Candidatus Kentron sp. FM]